MVQVHWRRASVCFLSNRVRMRNEKISLFLQGTYSFVETSNDPFFLVRHEETMKVV